MTDRPSFLSALSGIGIEAGLLDRLVAEAPFGVYVDHASEGCVFANDALLDQFGVDWDEFRGFGWARRIVREDAERMAAAIEEYERTLEPIDVTYRVRDLDGGVRWVHARVRAVADATGRHVGSLGLTRDVTEQRSFKEQAARGQKLEAIGQLSSRVAHDFNNLLAAMMIAVEALGPEVTSEHGRESLETIDHAIEQAAQITGQLLTLSRQRYSSIGAAPMDDELRRLEPLLRRTLGEGISLEMMLGAPGCYVPLDPGQVGQVVLNLATNGRDAMEGRGRLTIGTSAAGDRVKLVVEDFGAGMDVEVLRHVFEPFFTTKEPGRGTGLGLSILKDLAEFAGGRIDVASRPGSGTRITVELPVLRPDLHAAALAGARGEAAAERSERLLLVEDHDALRQSLGYALALVGFRVQSARSLAEAHRRCEAAGEPFDVLVTDVMLPDGNGVERVAALRAAQPRLPVVFTSGFVGRAGARLDSDDPLVRFIAKPFRPAALITAIEEVLAVARAAGS